jgi:four helix bundle protein
MSEQSERLKARTLAFAVAILRLIDKLPQTTSGLTVGRQLARSGTSIGANYRGSCNGRSRAEFVAKLGVVVEESEETVYWLEVIEAHGNLLPTALIREPLAEARELLAIFSKSVGTARANS